VSSGSPVSAFSPPSSLYVHVPFCGSFCRYCDFYSVAAGGMSASSISAVVDATVLRARSLAERFGAEKFSTIYVGGGTPTALPLHLLERLLEGLKPMAAPGCEWTVEANPDSLGPKQIELFRRCGLTRVSVGVQSLDGEDLTVLGRSHTAEAALSALRLCVDSGLATSADLIAGIPSDGPPDRLADSVRRLLDLGIGHLSIYDLTLEEGTPLYDSVSRGELRLPGADAQYASWSLARQVLERAGFRRYEVSNFAAPGLESLHNLGYWRLLSYIGAGPGAVSTLVGRPGGAGQALRIEEGRDAVAYADGPGAMETRISPRDAAFELIMMSFRTIFGLDLDDFSARFGRDPTELLRNTLAAWKAHLRPGERAPGELGARRRVALDQGGIDILNRFLEDCLGEIHERYPQAEDSREPTPG